jgi:hypothetical protein
MTAEKIGENFEAPLSDKEKILKSFHRLRYEYIDDIPPEKIIPYKTPGWDRYKCRTNFFNSISLKILLLQQKDLIVSPEAKQECENFLEFCKTIEGTSKFYQREDIDRANKVLDVLTKELS